MTEEEMAEEWVEKEISLGTSMYNPQIEHYCKQAFLVGLKAGKPKWHKVADGEYPSKEQLGKSFIVAFAFNDKTQEYYSFDCAEYIDKENFCTHTNNDDKVIAWCEIPKYTEE